MRFTKRQIKQIIKEELSAITEADALDQFAPAGALDVMSTQNTAEDIAAEMQGEVERIANEIKELAGGDEEKLGMVLASIQQELE